jgi:nucleotide-binding universal stress UspA family protein
MVQTNHVSWPAEAGISQPVLERILVGVDFRQPSLAAARWAATHFGSCTRIELAHVLSVPEVPGFLKPMTPVLDDRLETAVGSPLPGLRGFAATLGAKNLSVHVRAGHTVQSLADVAGKLDVDLVVLGRKTLDGNRGRTLERLIRRLTVPALVIGNGTQERPRRIVAAVDDAPIGRQVVDWAARLAQYFGAELILLHVLSDALLAHDWGRQERSCEQPGFLRLGSNVRWVPPTHAWLRGLGPTDGLPAVVRTIVAVGAVGPMILARARAARADLIVVGRSGAHATDPGGDIGSATRLALCGAQVPLLVVPGTGPPERHQVPSPAEGGLIPGKPPRPTIADSSLHGQNLIPPSQLFHPT